MDFGIPQRHDIGAHAMIAVVCIVDSSMTIGIRVSIRPTAMRC